MTEREVRIAKNRLCSAAMAADGKPYPKSEQVARCGNAVCPPIPAALVRANLPEICEEE